ncbi:Hypothetical predicted protein [Marmota monax]|uniref:Uncharacterized protein n=1 Tax=Marmota monax TaxID=9995 RepID=A0A5E4B9A5_MARMO|nr:Hypothetical predicted protein [Marmota monax]
MFPLPQKECREPATCLGSASPQDMGRYCRGDVEGECSRRAELKRPELCGVGDPIAMFSSASSCLSSRGRVIKWFWDSAEEGYRTYHRDEYDEDKNPNVSKALPGPKRELWGGYLP